MQRLRVLVPRDRSPGTAAVEPQPAIPSTPSTDEILPAAAERCGRAPRDAELVALGAARVVPRHDGPADAQRPGRCVVGIEGAGDEEWVSGAFILEQVNEASVVGFDG